MPRTSNAKALLESQSSDDSGIMAVVAKQMQSSWEKKRKEKETKYFAEAQAVLYQYIESHREEYLEAIAEMTTVYEKFVQDYAGVEVEIRKLLLQFSREQQKMLNLAENKSKQMVESEKVRERGQVQGMATAKKAMEDFNRFASMLNQHE
ncbi:uncharacterized protein B0H18DRAFT_74566 [Fomitopsis serialis]|uniref:uncharacterized protein n=1 Tax=Fomitopsis serialis TaxID=139415 RepID=UPI002008695D|nr:uncharacterized protein B0H18DRAFT_74566 [Neoantrodia serialis]KAH9916195.1 hypothetical protein B0H18DRAFT_74566 [Neoantrodia serialis]